MESDPVDPNKTNRQTTLQQEAMSAAPETISENDYRIALSNFDAAVCDAYAVSQAQASRLAPQNIAYATRVFNRLCAHAVSMVRASPYSRWVKADYEHWDFGAV